MVLAEHYSNGKLTVREQEIIAMLAKGKSNGLIAEELFISVNTVKFHLKNIFLKLNAGNRTEALIKANKILTESKNYPKG